MKVEINNENKAKLVALYNLYTSIWEKIDTLDGSDKIHVEYVYLYLKPVHQISDEDARELAKMYYESAHNIRVKNDSLRFDFYWGDIVESMDFYLGWDRLSSDYLRSKGYALPWMGLSVEEMVEAGWIKLSTK